MAKLKDRQRQIPYGFKFWIAELRYQSAPFSSFTAIVNSVHTLAQANIELFTEKKWPTDYDEIANWVDNVNAEICKSNGWREYYTDSAEIIVPPNPQPEEWPVWAKALRLLRKDRETGIGDTVARLIGAERSQAFKDWHSKTFGKSCGCAGRQRELNIKFPYTNIPNASANSEAPAQGS